MVRIRVPAIAAAAVLALAACSSIDGAYPSPGAAGAASDDALFNALFPPPPPVPPDEAAGTAAGTDIGHELADLHAALNRLSADIDESRRHLAHLQAEVERTRARIERLLAASNTGGIDADVRHEQTAVAPADRRPLVRIRYDRPAVDYADALREAVDIALARLPDAGFDVVAVAPAGAGGEPSAEDSGAAKLHAEEVMATLLDMGLPATRLTLSSAVSDGASVNEVHLYIR